MRKTEVETPRRAQGKSRRAHFNAPLFIIVPLSLFFLILASLVALPFFGASCRTRATLAPDDPAARERLRQLTRGGALPSEDDLKAVIAGAPNTETAALARLALARVKFSERDFAGAVALLEGKEARVLSEKTSIGDYVLNLRAGALEQSGRRTEARAEYERLARDYPKSTLARQATTRAAAIALDDNRTAAGVPMFLKKLIEADDGSALLLAAKSYERQNDSAKAVAAYRRLYFYAPAAMEAQEAAQSLVRLNSNLAPATSEEAIARAERLFKAKRYDDAATAYADAASRFPAALDAKMNLHHGVAAYQVGSRRLSEAVGALNGVPASANETRAEALYWLALANARARLFPASHAATDELRRSFPNSKWTPRAFVSAGQIAKDEKVFNEALAFFRAAVNFYPQTAETAPAQFELAWAAHDARNFNESARLLLEHLAFYADKNTDFRGRAGYWAARDLERAGRTSDARIIYEAMQARYDANWYGYLAKQRLEKMPRANSPSDVNPSNNFAPASPVARAVANLKTVSIAEETANTSEADLTLKRADALALAGFDREAIAELDKSLESTPDSLRLNLAKAKLHRAREENLLAFNALKRSYPDYSQMKPEELTTDEWDVFYPLEHWDTILAESRAKNLDPYTVAGLIRQESVFNPRATSAARAYGLMQLLVPTGQTVARAIGVERPINVDALYDPRLNIQLGTSYLRTQLDKFGRIEYVAAAYNAGPGRAVQWRASLPSEMDEWAEAIPFKETRGYVQGVVRNALQYKRLYDANGKFRPEVGAHPVRLMNAAAGADAATNNDVRSRRVSNEDEEE